MRRALCSLSALLILALSLLIAGNAALSGRAAAFSAEIEPLSGSPAAAEGLTLSLSASLASQLYWGADYSVGSGGFDTRFSYGEAIDCRDDSSGRSVYGVEFGSGTFFSGSLSDNDAIDAIFSGLAERALAAGAGRYEDYSETIYLADYFDYYPVDAHAIPSSEREGFAEFFRVPVLPGDSIDVSVSGVTPGGGASSLGMSSNDNTVYLALQSVETGTADYLAFDSSNPLADFDFSHIPGGFGIYRLPHDLDTGLPVSAGLECVYPLDPSQLYSVYLHSTNDGKLLLAAVQSLSGDIELYVFDAAAPASLCRSSPSSVPPGTAISPSTSTTAFWSTSAMKCWCWSTMAPPSPPPCARPIPGSRARTARRCSTTAPSPPLPGTAGGWPSPGWTSTTSTPTTTSAGATASPCASACWTPPASSTTASSLPTSWPTTAALPA